MQAVFPNKLILQFSNVQELGKFYHSDYNPPVREFVLLLNLIDRSLLSYSL